MSNKILLSDVILFFIYIYVWHTFFNRPTKHFVKSPVCASCINVGVDFSLQVFQKSQESFFINPDMILTAMRN